MSGTEAAANTDREIWREREGDYYADSAFITQGGALGINCGGRVIVRPFADWFAIDVRHRAASQPSMSVEDVEHVARQMYADNPHTVMSQALREATGQSMGEVIDWETFLRLGGDPSGLRRMARSALTAIRNMPLSTLSDRADDREGAK